MDRQQAGRLLDDVFNSEYTHENYEKFIIHLLNLGGDEIERKDYNSFIERSRRFSGFVEAINSFGVYTDNNGKAADILSVKLSKNNSKIRARVTQRNFIASWLKTARRNCALVAFYDDTEDWRFSFVELDYKTIRTKDGKVKDIEDLTPAKRLSFLVGKHESNHTCKKYLLDFITEDSKLPSLDSIRSAFGIENVSKEFFDRYKNLYIEVLESLNRVVLQDEKINNEFKIKDISPEEFSKKLLGQIVFIYFLQKKGWLGVSKTGKWGSGRKDFLRAVFNKEFGAYDNFFNDLLEPLFYNAFANSERDNEFYSTLNCRIPFLNGGLFEPIGGYDWVSTDITIDNKIFENIFNTFDEFNFTIKEDEPLEKEVAVDPEMLGKIFENLLKDNIRKGYGAFYTPREIVHYMCQESLVNYLDDNSCVDRDVIDALVRQGSAVIDIKDFSIPLHNHADELDKLLEEIRVVDPAVGSGAFPVGMLSEIVNARIVLGELKGNGEKKTPYQLKRAAIENSLYGVDIDAGAVDIAKLRFWLSLVIDEESEDHIDPLPNLEQKIMCGDSLLEKFHGVKLFDNSLIEKDAAYQTQIEDITLQLKTLYEKLSDADFGTDTSFVQDEIDKLKKEREKLNRQQNISGDKATVLVGGSFGASEGKLRLRELKRLQAEFFNETYKSKKETLRKQIDSLEWKFIEDSLKADGHGDDAVEEVRLLRKKRSKPFFLWRLYFNDVFTKKGGFDVVIGNPPYVQIQSMENSYKDALEDEGYDTFAKTGDLYCLFYERGYELLRDNGKLALITSNKWMRAGYGSKTRNFFATKTNPLTLIDFAGQKIFDSATVDVNILIFSKSENLKRTKACVVKEKCSGNLSDYIEQNSSFCSFNNENSWVILSPIEQQIKDKIERVGTPLKDWDIQINYGIKTGFNEAFIISGKKKDELIADDPKSAEIIRPILRGRDIKRYSYEFADLWLIATFPSRHYDIEDYPAVKKYLLSVGKERLEQTGKEYIVNGEKIKARKKTNNKWFETQDSISYWEDFSRQKIVWGEISDRTKFSLDENGSYYTEATTFLMTGFSLKYLLAFLNSKLSEYYFAKIGTTTGVGTVRWKKFKIETFEIPNIPLSEQEQFEEIIDQILKLKKENKNTTKLEKTIDLKIYKLLNLNPDEIGVVEGV